MRCPSSDGNCVASAPAYSVRGTGFSRGVISYPLLEGDAGTTQTIQHIRQLVDAGMKHPEVNRTALEILRQARAFGYDDERKVRAIYDWVLRRIGYVKDPPGKELLRPADVLLRVRAGDCDDINGVLLPSLLGTIGYPCQLVTISSNADAPEEFSHIYCVVNVGGKWIPLDAARRNTRFGSRPPRWIRKRVWSLLDDSYSDVAGLAGYQTSRRGRMAGLGFDWGSFANVLTAGTTGAANLISATRSQGQMFLPQVTPTAAQPYVPAAATDYTPLIFGGLLVGVFLLTRNR